MVLEAHRKLEADLILRAIADAKRSVIELMIVDSVKRWRANPELFRKVVRQARCWMISHDSLAT